MKTINKVTETLEKRWVSPSYSGLVLLGIALCFFGAATNTMAGWLYVLSGIIFAMLILAAILPPRSLRQLQIRRLLIAPVSAGDQLTLELEIKNPTQQPQTLLQIWDLLPSELAINPPQTPIELIEGNKSYHWTYYVPTTTRGVYYWRRVCLRTATPIGLFWCRREHQVNAKAIVYPQVLRFSQCPLVDNMGQEHSLKLQSDRRYQAATEGITKALRGYRRGDPIRLIHWRSSARFGELQVRELEVITGGQEVVICLDTATSWDHDNFEQAVIAAASLYFYASRAQLTVKLWTAQTNLVSGNRVVLETLAATQAQETSSCDRPNNIPLVWITQNSQNLHKLPLGSRWIFFALSSDQLPKIDSNSPGLVINPEESLASQLQKLPR